MRNLYLFVEGVDDERLIDGVVRPRVEAFIDHLTVVRYAQETTAKSTGYLRALKRSADNEIFVLADRDKAPCITRRKEQVIERFNQEIDFKQIIIVETTIEAWYLAGLATDNPLKIAIPTTTDSIDKQKFEQMTRHLRRRFTPQQIKVNILNCWDWDLALARNRSLLYFAQRLGLL